ncbi:hypothetical protein T459_34752 [Capsicum annuum]|uniref:non-specific serine/threonine protein kinase n=1 Tax=Capsicum annuum TaxID=4072 RepID=A0A2G2XVB9_CAPAN|nr:hypothetical protein T459_34752 [Capsicum annuum]
MTFQSDKRRLTNRPWPLESIGDSLDGAYVNIGDSLGGAYVNIGDSLGGTYVIISDGMGSAYVHDYQIDRGVSGLHGLKCSSRPGPDSGLDTRWLHVMVIPRIPFVNFHMNNFYGTIPPEIGNFTNLICLDLHTNQISGTIPSQIGSLIKLQILHIFDNHLNGPIPEEIGYLSELGNLKNLNYLELSNNQLTGSIPSSFGNLRNLQSLFLGNNNLIEEIPSSICNLTSLTLLHLFRNNLKGNILQCLGNISGLWCVTMSHNNLSGELPPSICNLTSLQILDLGRNNLMRAIPQCFGNMSSHLEVLDMQHSNLSGDNLLNDTFPMWLGTLPELRVLSLRLNKLHGPIRTSGSEYMFPELRILDLSRNDFSKNLPMSLFRHMKAMRTVDQTSKEPSYLGIHIIMILLQFHPRGWSMNLTASPEVIIILVWTVSIGYEQDQHRW